MIGLCWMRSVARNLPARPNLSIRISHEVTDDPAEALIRAADAADLLVIGCHHSADRWSIRTGPVAEAVMRGASCPVMLVSQPVDLPEHGMREV